MKNRIMTDPIIEHERLSREKLEDPNFRLTKCKAVIQDDCYNTDMVNKIEFRRTSRRFIVQCKVYGHKKVHKKGYCDMGHSHDRWVTEEYTFMLTDLEKESAEKLARWILGLEEPE